MGPKHGLFADRLMLAVFTPSSTRAFSDIHRKACTAIPRSTRKDTRCMQADEGSQARPRRVPQAAMAGLKGHQAGLGLRHVHRSAPDFTGAEADLLLAVQKQGVRRLVPRHLCSGGEHSTSILCHACRDEYSGTPRIVPKDTQESYPGSLQRPPHPNTGSCPSLGA